MMINITEIKLDHLYGKSFDELVAHNFYDLLESLANLMIRQFTISDTQIEHRTILHWEKEKLIDNVKEKESGWRRYSFFDYVWLRVVTELRNFGTPIPIVKKIKTNLFASVGPEMVAELTEDDYKRIEAKFSELPENIKNDFKHINAEFIRKNSSKQDLLIKFNKTVIDIVYQRVPTYLLIHPDGESEIIMFTGENHEVAVNKFFASVEKNTSLLVSLTKIVDEFFITEKFSGNTYFKLSPLSCQEKEIVDIIRAGGVNNINIQLKSGKEFYVEILRKRPAANVIDQIEGIIAKNKYTRITLDTEKGKVAYINEIEKRIIK